MDGSHEDRTVPTESNEVNRRNNNLTDETETNSGKNKNLLRLHDASNTEA